MLYNDKKTILTSPLLRPPLFIENTQGQANKKATTESDEVTLKRFVRDKPGL